MTHKSPLEEAGSPRVALDAEPSYSWSHKSSHLVHPRPELGRGIGVNDIGEMKWS